MDPVLETALVVVLDAPPLAELHRAAHPRAVARGIPFHITVLYPFVPRAELGEDELARARGVVGRHRAFDFTLERLETWPGVIWVAPEPDEPLRALTAALHEAFPQCPPYGGRFEEVIPHATLAEGGDDLDAALERLRPRVEPLLPLSQRATDVTLLVEDERDRWREEARLPLQR